MIFNNDEVGKMVSEIKSLATPLQDLILREAMTDRDYANKAAAELLALRERVGKLAAILQWIYDEGEGGTYRPDIQAVLVAHNRSQ